MLANKNSKFLVYRYNCILIRIFKSLQRVKNPDILEEKVCLVEHQQLNWPHSIE